MLWIVRRGFCPMWQLVRSQNRNINSCLCEENTSAGNPSRLLPRFGSEGAHLRCVQSPGAVRSRKARSLLHGCRFSCFTLGQIASRPTDARRTRFVFKDEDGCFDGQGIPLTRGCRRGARNFRTGLFLLLGEAGIVCGSEYVENSGQKMNEVWRYLVGATPLHDVKWLSRL